jgi:hypothetical protein
VCIGELDGFEHGPSQAIMHDFPFLRDMPAPRGEAFPSRASEWNSTPEAGKSPQGFLTVQPGISNPWLPILG